MESYFYPVPNEILLNIFESTKNEHSPGNNAFTGFVVGEEEAVAVLSEIWKIWEIIWFFWMNKSHEYLKTHTSKSQFLLLFGKSYPSLLDLG